MMKPMTQLLADLRKHRIAPTITTHQVNGKTTFRWHVDDDDDRYVEATDSLHSATFVLHRRDKMDTVIIIVKNVPAAITWIDAQLKVLLDIPR